MVYKIQRISQGTKVLPKNPKWRLSFRRIPPAIYSIGCSIKIGCSTKCRLNFNFDSIYRSILRSIGRGTSLSRVSCISISEITFCIHWWDRHNPERAIHASRVTEFASNHRQHYRAKQQPARFNFVSKFSLSISSLASFVKIEFQSSFRVPSNWICYDAFSHEIGREE